MPCPEKFRETLKQYEIPESVVGQIEAGFDTLTSKSPKKLTAAYFKRALDILTGHISPETLIRLMAENGCCKGGARAKASKAFARANHDKSLSEKLTLIPSVPNMGRPVLNEDGSLTVHAVYYSDGEKYLCACPNYHKTKRDYPVSRNYCFCCAGHFQHHYEIMLGCRLKPVEIVSSPLDSGGRNPCVIRFVFAD